MSFFTGRDFAVLQILKKWKQPYLLNWVEYCDEILHTHWHWRDVAHEVVKWHFGLIEVLPRFKFWKKWNLTLKPFGILNILQCCWKDLAQGIAKWHLSSVEVLPSAKFLKKWKWPYLLNILVYFDKILHTHYYWHGLDRGIAKCSPRDWKMTFNIGRGCFELQILKKWKWPNCVNYCDETLHTHWYWQDVAQEIVKCHLALVKAVPSSKF